MPILIIALFTFKNLIIKESEYKLNMEETMKCNTCNSFVTKITQPECDIKPINSNITFNPISVSILPPNVNWFDMEGFTSTKYGPFRFNFINANNHTIAGISFYISYNHHGSFNSIGNYLADATVSPIVIFANPGYYFSCNVTASDALNYGTKAAPIAGVNLKVQMQVKSYNKLALERNYYNLENTKIPKYSSNSTKSFNLINLTSSNNSNAIEQYLIVNVRGDGLASIVCGYGY